MYTSFNFAEINSCVTRSIRYSTGGAYNALEVGSVASDGRASTFSIYFDSVEEVMRFSKMLEELAHKIELREGEEKLNANHESVNSNG